MALQYQRLDRSGRDLVLKEYPLETLVKKAVKNMASVFIYNKTGLQIEAMPGNVLTDEKWFLFVLEQVIGNAAKYTAGRENGKIRIYSGRTDKGETVIVEDNGVAIRRGDIPRVIEWRIYRVITEGGKRDLKGIGLFLCRQVSGYAGTVHSDRVGGRKRNQGHPGYPGKNLIWNNWKGFIQKNN